MMCEGIYVLAKNLYLQDKHVSVTFSDLLEKLSCLLTSKVLVMAGRYKFHNAYKLSSEITKEWDAQ